MRECVFTSPGLSVRFFVCLFVVFFVCRLHVLVCVYLRSVCICRIVY